jgi:hypothetical protein
MYIVTRERAAAQARALSGALALANLAGWKIERSSSLILAPPFRNYLHVEQAQLLLVPSIEPSRGDLDVVGRGMREARCDALVVKASSEGHRTLYCAVGEWLRRDNHWRHARRLWLSRTNEAWLVADPMEYEEPEVFYRLAAGRLRPSIDPPTYNHGELAAGFARADACLAAVWGDR